MRDIIDRVEKRVREILTGESTGHDWYHIDQVRTMALRLAHTEGGDPEIIELAALVHDVGDRKFYPTKEEGQRATREVLQKARTPPGEIEKVMQIVDTMSYSTGLVPESLEGKIVQDADRLFALGAIGIARTFAFGGKKERVIHDPAQQREFPSTINHFYEKLLLVKNKMNTASAKRIAQTRHEYMEGFLKQFYTEWDSKDAP